MAYHPRDPYLGRPLGRPLNRRDFLRRSMGAAVAMPSLAAILAACTKPGTVEGVNGDGGTNANGGTEGGGVLDLLAPRPDQPVTLPMNGEPIPSDLPIETGVELQIFNWVDYVWKAIIRRFLEQHSDQDISFKAVTTFNNMEEAVSKLQAGEIQADVFFPTIDAVPKLAAAGLLQPLNHELIPNLEQNCWGVYQNPYYDQEWRYTVPYTVYTTGIAYRRDVVPDDQIYGMDNPWEILWDPSHRDRVGVYDSYRDTIQTALLKDGITDISTGNQEDLDTARDELLAMLDAVNPRATINGAYKRLPQGEFDVHLSWSGDIVAGWGYVPTYTRSYYENLGYWFPDDRRGPVDNDCIAIPANAPHPRLAHEFINFMLDFQNAMDNFSWVGYQPPQNEAQPDLLTQTEGMYSQISGWAEPAEYVLPWMEAAVVRQSDFDVGYRQAPLIPEVDERWNDVWQQFKAGVKSNA